MKVYRCSGTTQWYTAVIISFDERNFLLTLTDDTVLEVHRENPTLLRMHLIDDGLLQSIIEGDNSSTKKNTCMRRRTQRKTNNQASLSSNTGSCLDIQSRLPKDSKQTTEAESESKGMTMNYPSLSTGSSVPSSSTSHLWALNTIDCVTGRLFQGVL